MTLSPNAVSCHIVAFLAYCLLFLVWVCLELAQVIKKDKLSMEL